MEDINYFLKISLSIFPVVIFILFTVVGVKMEKERPVKRIPFYGEGFRVIGYTEDKEGPPVAHNSCFFGFPYSIPFGIFQVYSSVRKEFRNV
jgi:hypothetical protein